MEQKCVHDAICTVEALPCLWQSPLGAINVDRKQRNVDAMRKKKVGSLITCLDS